MTERSPRLIRLKEVLHLVPLSRTSIYNRINDGTFPKARDLGGNVVAWYEQDVLDWIEALPIVGDEGDGKGSIIKMGVGMGVAA